MSKVTLFSTKDMKQILESAGFQEEHCGNGSHVKLSHKQTGDSVAIPYKKELKTPMAKKLFEEAGLSELWKQACNGTKPKQLCKQAEHVFNNNAMQPAHKLYTSPGAAAKP